MTADSEMVIDVSESPNQSHSLHSNSIGKQSVKDNQSPDKMQINPLVLTPDKENKQLFNHEQQHHSHTKLSSSNSPLIENNTYQQQLVNDFYNDQNKAQIQTQQQFMQDTLANQDELFTKDQLSAIESNTDCHIDDPELLLSKKHLQVKFTPMSTIHAINGKFKECGIAFKQAEKKNPDDPKTMLFSCYVQMAIRDVHSHAEESSKKHAMQRASQKFLKQLFPKCTWIDMINILQNEKEQLERLIKGQEPVVNNTSIKDETKEVEMQEEV